MFPTKLTINLIKESESDILINELRVTSYHPFELRLLHELQVKSYCYCTSYELLFASSYKLLFIARVTSYELLFIERVTTYFLTMSCDKDKNNKDVMIMIM